MGSRGHSRLLKVVPFESLGTVSYSPSIVTMAVSAAILEILSVKKMAWPWNLGLGSFKVIENGAVWETIYDFLLVRYCNYSSVFYHLRVIWREILLCPWNVGYRSLKVIESGTIWKLGYGFLFAVHSNMAIYATILRYSASKNGLTLKSGFGVVQGHWKWRGSTDHVWVSISPPL